MVQNTYAKITALVVSLGIIMLSLIHPGNVISSFKNTLCPPFLHTSFLHAALNAWCLISLVFIYNISLIKLICAYAISISFTAFVMPYLPTVGLSGICFFLMGSIIFEVKRKIYYQIWITLYIAIGFIFPSVNGWIHLYCYIIGMLVAVLNKPIR